MTREQGTAIIHILRCWLGASVLAGGAAVALSFGVVWLGVVLAAVAVVVAGLGVATSEGSFQDTEHM
ncbi:hypothetical protein [Jannaschia sp. R86511]|uniref:hypothetical protein n=1 Tax=Jannaschia sp. R86511 TaxID=3093853 RepID=UPI0036D27C7D